MKNKITVGRNIYPDFDEFSIPELNKFLGRHSITVDFLLDSGIMFTYDPNVVIFKNYPNSGSFISQESGRTLFTIIEDFGKILITNLDGDITYFNIPILENNLKINL